MNLDTILNNIKKSVDETDIMDYDLSKEFSDDETSTEEYQLQERLRLDTQSLIIDYYTHITMSESAIGLYDNANILTTLEEVKNQFGSHPFKHVIEGRIAKIVQTELGLSPEFSQGFKKGEVPIDLQHYAEFKFEPWNDPHLNYNSVLDIIRQNRLECIPPDYDGIYADLISR